MHDEICMYSLCLDFCDYFLVHEYPAKNVPKKCICLWYLINEYRKEGIEWDKINDDECESYKKYATMVRKPFGKKLCANGICMPNATINEYTAITMSIPTNNNTILHDPIQINFLHDSSSMQSMHAENGK